MGSTVIIDRPTREWLNSDAHAGNIIIKDAPSGTSFYFTGFAGPDVRIATPVDTEQQVVYFGVSVPEHALSLADPFYGHPIPRGVSLTTLQALWHQPAGGWADLGDGDWAKHFRTVAWHPDPGGYHTPGKHIGFDPTEHTQDIFAHSLGFTISDVETHGDSRRFGGHDYFLLDSVTVRGHDANPILDGEAFELISRDNRGPGVDPITGKGEGGWWIEDTPGHSRAWDVKRALLAHDAENAHAANLHYHELAASEHYHWLA